MMEMMRLLYCSVLVSLVMLSSCADELLPPNEPKDEVCSVIFDIGMSDGTRSCIFPDEEAVDNLNIYIFCQGLLIRHIYENHSGSVPVDLNAGSSYNVYAVANVGEVEPSVSESDFVSKLVLDISSVTDMEEFLPLAGCVRQVTVSRQEQRVAVTLERLVSKILFSLDRSALDGLEVTSVRLCQSPVRVRPFADGGSAAGYVTEVADGDYCTDEDISALNEGEEVNFFALENCQGVLLPDNGDPSAKIPLFLDYKADLCTYLEVACRFDGTGLCEGDVTYRLYLGQDACTDFNVLRNSVLRVSLCLTVDGLKNGVSWRVDPDYALRDGYASGWISRGRHNEDDLYVGEKFEYSIWLSDEMTEYIGGDMSECELFFRCHDTGEEGHVRFSEFRSSDVNACFVEALCVRPAEGEVCLRDKSGRLLAVLSDNVCVNVPGVVVSDRPYDDGSVGMVSCNGNFNCLINGPGSSLYVYFVDCEFLNLNVSSGCGYDLSVFDFDVEPQLVGNVKVLSTMNMNVGLGNGGSNGPVLSYDLECVHDGRRHDVNLSLLSVCSHHDDLSWRFSEKMFGVEEELRVGLEYLPVELKLVDNDWAGYGDSQLAMVVDNPSRLPLSVDYWQFVTVNDLSDAGSSGDAAGKVEGRLNLYSMEYVVNQYNVASLPVYGSSCSFVSERNGSGDEAVEDGDLLVYDLKGVDTDDIAAALAYEGWGYDTMSHHVQVSFTDGTPVRQLTVDDCLAEGSAGFADKYGRDGFNDRGIWLYENGSLVLAPEARFSSYPGLNPDNIRSMHSQTPVVGTMNYDKEDQRLYIAAYELGAEGLVLDSKSSAKADGYVRTYPDGTWGKAVDNYCHEELVDVCEDISVRYDGDKVIADENTVRNVFEQIYANCYYDSWNKVGSANNYMHAAHPTSLSMKMSFKLSDKDDDGAYLFTALFPDYVFFRHPQEGVYYSVPVEFTHAAFKFVEVARK